MPSSRTGVVASSLPSVVVQDYVWDASVAATVQQPDGSAAVVGGPVATWRPTSGTDTALTRWTSMGASATLQEVSSLTGGTRPAIRSVTENLLYMPGNLPLYNVTWFVAYRWTGAPGSYSHVLSKGANRAYGVPLSDFNTTQQGWGFLRKQMAWGQIGFDRCGHFWEYAGDTMLDLSSWTNSNRARDLNNLRVAVLQFKVTLGQYYGSLDMKARLTHPTSLYKYTFRNMFPPAKEVAWIPWTLGGYLQDAITREIWASGGADIAIHEVRMYASLMDDASIAAVSDSLNAKWA